MKYIVWKLDLEHEVVPWRRYPGTYQDKDAVVYDLLHSYKQIKILNTNEWSIDKSLVKDSENLPLPVMPPEGQSPPSSWSFFEKFFLVLSTLVSPKKLFI